MKYMDEQFLMLEGGQDSIECTSFTLNKELHLYEDTLSNSYRECQCNKSGT